jgi:hypothetical protein
MKSYGKFSLEVKVPPGEDAQQRANDIMQLIREEIDDPNDFLDHLEAICQKTADFLGCKLVLTDKEGILLARFVFE